MDYTTSILVCAKNGRTEIAIANKPFIADRGDMVLLNDGNLATVIMERSYTETEATEYRMFLESSGVPAHGIRKVYTEKFSEEGDF